ncbi:MAG: hypothetical protein OEU97_01390 [Dehalococcoidia bacterium]|nr:hypothetical protein [Dehalococcoidia bacterium]MDH4300319.1 hypothetical protein [Dehalococcoidia bacterium]MDH4366768.1 hypothetical protein [Dehalococcoidia bacterium]
MQVLNKLRTVSRSRDILRLFIGILVFGSIWGLVEATLGGALHLVHFAYKGAITGGFGMAIMAAFVVTYRRPKLAFCIAVTAALFKPLSALIYGQPIFAPFVYNPASAILLEGLAFSLVVSLLFKGFESSIKTRIGAGVAAGYLSFILFGVLASAAGMGNWASWGLVERVSSVFANGTGLAIVGTCLLLLGHLVSTKLRPNFWQLMTVRPRAFYASTIAITAFCWIGAAVAFASGL